MVCGKLVAYGSRVWRIDAREYTMAREMEPYLELVKRVLEEGEARPDRTGVGTRSLFGHQMRFDLEEGFPLLTNRKIHLRSIVHELLWFIQGQTNIAYLKENRVSIWDEWANAQGELGPV